MYRDGDDFAGAFGELSLGADVALLGDFYGEPEDVVRGLTLSPGDELCCGNLDQEWDGGQSKKLEGFEEQSPEGASSKSVERFQATDLPPTLPAELAAFLEVTTLRLSQSSSVAVGNSLLELLENAAARVYKLSRIKFSIKAEVIVSGLHCHVKIRIYQQQDTCIVEFRRYDGDAVAFNKFYCQATHHLHGLAFSSDTCKIPKTDALALKTSIAPLLDMADSSQDTRVLSEVASGLTGIDPTLLSTPHALSVLQKLRQVNDFSVAFPVARVLEGR